MRPATSVLLILALGTLPAAAQQAPPAAQQPSPAAPTPDQNGVYRVVPGVDSPYLTSPAIATAPADQDSSRPVIVRFTAVIAADGSIANLKVMFPDGDPWESSASAAIQQSKFAPGAVNGTAVPVLICLRVPFLRVQPAVPRVVPCHGPGAGGFGNHVGMPPGVTPPHAIYVGNPEYSNEARRKKIQGVVLLSTLVNEQGEPTDIRVERTLGYGLDENAVRAVSQYRFEPARDRDGKPVAVRVAVEVNYRLY
ncbi:MAG: energy transducer TonB [Acidobacteriaceae bacterium]